MGTFSRKLNHHWKCREQRKHFETVSVIIFWHFLIINHRSPQVKRCLISSITNLVHELPYELPNDLRIRRLGNIKKMSNLGGDAA